MCRRVDEDNGVRRHFRVLRFYEKLDRVVEVVRCLFDEHRLGRRLRMRLREWQRSEQLFRSRRFEEDGRAKVWRRRVRAQTTAYHVE